MKTARSSYTAADIPHTTGVMS